MPVSGLVATHRRSYCTGEQVLAPLHFLAILHTRPGTLTHPPVYRDGVLAVAFAELRRELKTRLGRSAGPRHFFRVLQLLARHPLDREKRAIRQVRRRGHPTAVAIAVAADRLARSPDPTGSDTTMSLPASPLPDLSPYDRPLGSHHPVSDESLLVTSTLSFGEWGTVFLGDRMTAALLARLTHQCDILEATGECYRFRESVQPIRPARLLRPRPRHAPPTPLTRFPSGC